MDLTEAMDLNRQLTTALAQLAEVRAARDRQPRLSFTRRRLDGRAEALSRHIRRIVARVRTAP